MEIVESIGYDSSWSAYLAGLVQSLGQVRVVVGAQLPHGDRQRSQAQLRAR